MSYTIITTDPDEIICNELDALKGNFDGEIERIKRELKDGTLTSKEALNQVEVLGEVYKQKINAMFDFSRGK